MRSKIRLALAGLTAVALMSGVMAADPADAGKKKKKRAKAKSAKVIKKGSKVVQVSKGGNATAGNGGAGGAGGSSGKVFNTGNVGGGAGGGLTQQEAACLGAAFALEDALTPAPGIPGPITDARVVVALARVPNCPLTLADIPASILACIRAVDEPVLDAAEALGCLDDTPGVPGTAGAVFSGDAGNGGTGGDGGSATGGAGGDNTNISSVTVSHDDHSIDVNK
jgi:hypothetical protein